MKTTILILASLLALSLATSAAEPSVSQRAEKQKSISVNNLNVVDPESSREDRIFKEELRTDLLFRKLTPIAPKEAGFEEDQPVLTPEKKQIKPAPETPAVKKATGTATSEPKVRLAPESPKEAGFSEI